MPKKTHSLRFEDRTWRQLAELQDWLQVGNRTKVLEVLVEKESEKMSKSVRRMVDVLKASGYKAGQVTEDTYIVFDGKNEFAIEKPDRNTRHTEEASGSTYCTAIAGVTVEKLNKELAATSR